MFHTVQLIVIDMASKKLNCVICFVKSRLGQRFHMTKSGHTHKLVSCLVTAGAGS